MKFFGERVLFIGAHPDDIELGCGALIHQIAPQTDKTIVNSNKVTDKPNNQETCNH